MRPFNVYVLDDNAFFVQVFQQHLQFHINRNPELRQQVRVKGFTDYLEFLRNINPEVDLTFLDFYLGYGVNAFGLLSDVTRYDFQSSIVVMSEMQNFAPLAGTLEEYIDAFIPKDAAFIPHSLRYLDQAVSQRKL